MRQKSGKKQNTLLDIAVVAGVAPMTVSRVVNQNGYVSDETREKVLQVVKEMNYRRNGLARNLKRQMTETIGLVLGDISNPYSTEVAHAVRQAAKARGYNVLICISEHSAEEDIAAFETLENHGVDGIIVATRSNESGDDWLQEIVANGVPVVVIGRDFVNDVVDSISADNLRGGFEATQHLIDLGHERIAFIGAYLDDKTKLKRLQGYLKALESHKIEIDERLVTGLKQSSESSSSYSTEKVGYECMKRLLSLPKPPTSVFARNDFTAIGAMSAIKEMNLRIPQDVAIIGFDDIPLAIHTSPPLSTIRQPMKLQGQLAAESLLRRIENNDSPRQAHVLNCDLIVRESTVGSRK
ncbi:MAG: LacI family DNA-binding transcriptional regulator [Pyrinomonadaceae bacterium]|nr:LacI family DNA-binding transcriptional regulator [Pyrinomonadaceae bacterium]